MGAAAVLTGPGWQGAPTWLLIVLLVAYLAAVIAAVVVLWQTCPWRRRNR